MPAEHSDRIEVVSTNVSVRTGTIKQPVPQIEIDENGIVGDAHAGLWHRQVSILAQESIDRFSAEAAGGRRFAPGEFAENITTRGIDLGGVSVLDNFKIGPVELQVTQIGKKCHGNDCAIYQQIGKCVMPKQGIFCRVVTAGAVRPGDTVVYTPRMLRFLIITLSDRASSGQYEDRSGPAIRTILEDFFCDKRWHTDIKNLIIGDDAERLRCELQTAGSDGVDVIFTTGGTGAGPRDITPDVVMSLAEKTIPGIMEHIRIKFGREKPNALLSRSVAVVFGQTLIYTLPGSVTAVGQYTPEILKTLEHLIFMLHGLDVH